MHHAINRRNFLRQSAVGTGWALASAQLLAAEPTFAAGAAALVQQETKAPAMANQIGIYGPWAADIAGQGPARLSFRNPQFSDLAAWRKLRGSVSAIGCCSRQSVLWPTCKWISSLFTTACTWSV